MDIEKAKKILNELSTFDYVKLEEGDEAIECVLSALDNSVSKDEIKEKIEELDEQEKKELKGLKGQDRYFVKQIYMAKRSNLQELLNKGE